MHQLALSAEELLGEGGSGAVDELEDYNTAIMPHRPDMV